MVCCSPCPEPHRDRVAMTCAIMVRNMAVPCGMIDFSLHRGVGLECGERSDILINASRAKHMLCLFPTPHMAAVCYSQALQRSGEILSSHPLRRNSILCSTLKVMHQRRGATPDSYRHSSTIISDSSASPRQYNHASGMSSPPCKATKFSLADPPGRSSRLLGL